MSDVVIKVENLGKKYIIAHQGRGRYKTFREELIHQVHDFYSRTRRLLAGQPVLEGDEMEEFWALQDINFEIKQGERVGIIGRNGAGKSTLLKILSRITEPTTGRVFLKGRVASLLEVGTGFHQELTGRENIFLNGAILGMSRAEIKRKFDEIVEFSGVEKFLDTPVKRYSSGMYVRLAFSVAAHLEPEILIVDEVLAVGDSEFQKKCLKKMQEVNRNEGKTILFVSHDLNAILSLCKIGILINKGKLLQMDDMNNVVRKYLHKESNEMNYFNELKKNNSVYITEIYLTNVQNEKKNVFYFFEEILINFKLVILELNLKYDLFVIVLDQNKRRIFSCETTIDTDSIILKLHSNQFVRGTYTLKVMINIPKIGTIEDLEDVCEFTVIDNGSFLIKHGDYDYGYVFGRFDWIK